MTTTSLTVDPTYDGIPDVAHGGYVAGLMATELRAPSVAVRLRRPIPTGSVLALERTGRARVELRDGETVLAEGAATAGLALDVPPRVSLADAEAAARHYPGHERHVFPACFCCGPEHPGGLHIFPGPVPGRRVVAAPWTPVDSDTVGRVPPELVWAALDCPQLWTLIVHQSSPVRVVSSTLAARLERPVLAGEPHVVMAWPAGRGERGWLAGAAVVDRDGAVCAFGLQTAVEAKWGVPLGLANFKRLAAPVAG